MTPAKAKKVERWTVGRKVEAWLGVRKQARPRLRPYNQSQLAERVGVSKATVGFWIDPKKDSVPTKENLRALAQVMCVSLEWLTDETRGIEDLVAGETADAVWARYPASVKQRFARILADENQGRALLAAAAAIEEAYARGSAGRR